MSKMSSNPLSDAFSEIRLPETVPKLILPPDHSMGPVRALGGKVLLCCLTTLREPSSGCGKPGAERSARAIPIPCLLRLHLLRHLRGPGRYTQRTPAWVNASEQ